MTESDSKLADQRPEPRRKRRWAWAIFVTVALAATIGYVGYWLKRTAAISQGHSGFRQAAIALNNYGLQVDRLPQAKVGSPGISWRFAIEPFIEGPGVPFDYTLAWNDPYYAKWAASRHGCYVFGPGESRDTNIVAVVGSDTAWDAGKVPQVWKDGEIKHATLPAPDALLCIECRETGIHWMEPGDFDVDSEPLRHGGIIRNHQGKFHLGNGCGGIHVMFADLAVWYLSDETPIAAIQKFLTLTDARRFDRDTELRAYRLWKTEIED